MIDTEKIFQLKQEINKLLEQKPELKELQKKIDYELEKAGNQQNRCAVISEMMIDSFKELNKNLNQIKQITESIKLD